MWMLIFQNCKLAKNHSVPSKGCSTRFLSTFEDYARLYTKNIYLAGRFFFGKQLVIPCINGKFMINIFAKFTFFCFI